VIIPSNFVSFFVSLLSLLSTLFDLEIVKYSLCVVGYTKVHVSFAKFTLVLFQTDQNKPGSFYRYE
jgi:hypothetical protein